MHAIPCFSSARVIRGHASRRYTSRYLGKRVAKEDSSLNGPDGLSAGVKGSIWLVCSGLVRTDSSCGKG